MVSLYDGAWVIVAGQPLAQRARERLKGIFSIAGRLYAANGHACEQGLHLPAIQMVLDMQTARENGLISAGNGVRFR